MNLVAFESMERIKKYLILYLGSLSHYYLKLILMIESFLCVMSVTVLRFIFNIINEHYL